MKDTGRVNIHPLVFFTAFTILAYEINFTRIFAYSQWHNLSSLIITMAMMGFGASGSVVAVFRKRIESGFRACLLGAAALFPLCLTLGFIVSTQLDFNPYELTFSPNQAVSILLYFFLMGIGFFWGAVILCMAFIKYTVSMTYFVNLAGSAAGVVFVLCLSFVWHPYDMMGLIVLISLIPLCLLARKESRMIVAGAAGVCCLVAATLFIAVSFLNPKQVSQYKPVSMALDLPRARIAHEAYSPLGVVQVLEAEGLRSTSGLSLASPFQVPVQKIIFLNGETGSPIIPYTGELDGIGYLRYLTSYLPFYVVPVESRGRVLIVGSGGGESILKSVLSGFKTIDAIEVDPNVISLMKQKFGPFSGNIYTLSPVNVMNREARNFIKQTRHKYDLIELSMVDAYNASASGVYSLNESYLYTVDAIKEYISRLSDTGILSVTRWTVTPARDNLKLFNMVISALKQSGIAQPGNHIIAVRSLQTLTLLVFKTPVPKGAVQQTQTFSKDRVFDLVYYPGIRREEVNRNVRLDTPVYYRAMTELLSSESEFFIDGYPFDIRAATDDRPYFYNFFKPKVWTLIRTFGPSQIPVTEWGYLLLLIILAPVLVLSLIFILAPLAILKRPWNRMNWGAVLYFSLIGAGFFFIEMPLIQKMILFLGHPVYAISVIIASILIFSSLGSYFSGKRLKGRFQIPFSTLLISLTTGIYLLTMDRLFHELIFLGFASRLCVAVVFTAPLGFFMGIPFPAGLERLKATDPSFLPMAWGINGFFSVISILLATLIAVIFGFRAVLVVAVFCYLLAGRISLKPGFG